MASVSGHDLDAVTAPRERLVAAAIRMLEEGGPEALQARRLAAEIGTSTMAVYTHFGGMRQLVEAVAREGYARLGRLLADVPETADPVADLFEMGHAYREYAMTNPQLFRVMYGVTAPGATGWPEWISCPVISPRGWTRSSNWTRRSRES